MGCERRELGVTWIALGVSAVGFTLFAYPVVATLSGHYATGSASALVQQGALLLLALAVLGASFGYLLARRGFLQQRAAHHPATTAELEAFLADAPPVTFLLPTKNEALARVRRALMSCALQEYPHRRVVLLNDEPKTARLVEKLQATLDQAAAPFVAARAAFWQRQGQGGVNVYREQVRLAELHEVAARWLEKQAAEHPGSTPSDRLYTARVLLERATTLRRRARELKDPETTLDVDGVARTYGLLATRFQVELESFERRGYANLPHEGGEALNLECYLSLMGRDLRVVACPDGSRALEPCSPEEVTFSVPAADYVVTVDADGLLMPEYAARLVHVMQQPENERVAVAQARCGPVPGAEGLVERVAGVAADMSDLLHQGLTHYGAAFWAGASAVFRYEALEEIQLARCSQERTAVEATLDLAARGWTVTTYPQRLAYGATPADFAALVRQRRHAPSGVSSLPKLLRGALANSLRRGALSAGALRAQHLLSLTLLTFGYLGLLLWPFASPSLWLALALVPACALYGRDLVQQGHRLVDLAQLVALELLLLVVNLAAISASLEQAVTGRRLSTRTVPARYVLLPLGLAVACLGLGVLWLLDGAVVQSLFLGLNGLVLAYATLAFIGLREGAEAVKLGLVAPALARLRPRPRPSREPARTSAVAALESGFGPLAA